MKAKRRFNIWLWVLLCVPCLLASCDHDVHDGENEGGLSVSLTWADEADQGTEVKDVKLWIFNADDGSLVEEKHDGSAQEVASQRFALSVGHYQILAATNLIEPFFIGEATRATLNMNQLMFGLSNPSASPDHAYYGVTDIGIDKSNVNYITKNEMRHILAELKNSKASNTAGPTIYNKVVEKMATGIARTASHRMITLAREYLT